MATGVDFLLCKSEFTAIIGVNGIGKSTLLRTIAKVQPSLGGQIHLKNQPLEDFDAEHLAKNISVVLTQAIISKNLSVKEVVGLGRQPHTNWLGTLSHNDSSKINEALELLDLKDLAQQKCYELSDGQLQRVMIARALAQDTEIILLDEPTTHLDLYHKVHILKLLRSIAHDLKKTILFTSHEIELALQLCDKMLVLDNDKNRFGAPSKLIAMNAFENLFPEDTVRFESSTGRFKIQK